MWKKLNRGFASSQRPLGRLRRCPVEIHSSISIGCLDFSGDSVFVGFSAVREYWNKEAEEAEKEQEFTSASSSWVHVIEVVRMAEALDTHVGSVRESVLSVHTMNMLDEGSCDWLTRLFFPDCAQWRWYSCLGSWPLCRTSPLSGSIVSSEVIFAAWMFLTAFRPV